MGALGGVGWDFTLQPTEPFCMSDFGLNTCAAHWEASADKSVSVSCSAFPESTEKLSCITTEARKSTILVGQDVTQQSNRAVFTQSASAPNSAVVMSILDIELYYCSRCGIKKQKNVWAGFRDSKSAFRDSTRPPFPAATTCQLCTFFPRWHPFLDMYGRICITPRLKNWDRDVPVSWEFAGCPVSCYGDNVDFFVFVLSAAYLLVVSAEIGCSSNTRPHTPHPRFGMTGYMYMLVALTSGPQCSEAACSRVVELLIPYIPSS